MSFNTLISRALRDGTVGPTRLEVILLSLQESEFRSFNTGLTVALGFNILCCLVIILQIFHSSWSRTRGMSIFRTPFKERGIEESKPDWLRRIALDYMCKLHARLMPAPGDVFPFVLAIGIMAQSGMFLWVVSMPLMNAVRADPFVCRYMAELVWVGTWIPAVITLVFLVETIVRILTTPRLQPRTWVTIPTCIASIIVGLLLTWIPTRSILALRPPLFTCADSDVLLITHVRKHAVGGMALLALMLPISFFVSLTIFLHLRHPSISREQEAAMGLPPPCPKEEHSARMVALIAIAEVGQWIFLIPYFAIISMEDRASDNGSFGTAMMGSLVMCLSGVVLLVSYLFLDIRLSRASKLRGGRDLRRKASWWSTNTGTTSRSQSSTRAPHHQHPVPGGFDAIHNFPGNTEMPRPRIPSTLPQAPRPAQQPIYARRAERKKSREEAVAANLAVAPFAASELGPQQNPDQVATDIFSMLGASSNQQLPVLPRKSSKRQSHLGGTHPVFRSGNNPRISEFPAPPGLPGLYLPEANLVQTPPPTQISHSQTAGTRSRTPPSVSNTPSRQKPATTISSSPKRLALNPPTPPPAIPAPSPRRLQQQQQMRQSVRSTNTYSQYFRNPRESRDSRLFAHSRNSSIGSDFTMLTARGGNKRATYIESALVSPVYLLGSAVPGAGIGMAYDGAIAVPKSAGVGGNMEIGVAVVDTVREVGSDESEVGEDEIWQDKGRKKRRGTVLVVERGSEKEGEIGLAVGERF